MRMDALTFISDVISALAWPLALVAVVALLRPALSRTIEHLRSLTVPGFGEIVFGQELALAQRLADESPVATVAPLTVGTPDDGDDDVDVLVRLAELAPRATVLEAWGELEASARAAIPADEDVRRPPTAGRLIDLLLSAGLVDDGFARMYDILRGLRNRVAHEPNFSLTTDEAIEYARLARGLSRSIDSEDPDEE